MTASTRALNLDQARTPAFRATLAVQAAAALIFGLVPLLATAAYASLLGFSGADPLIYRLGGAATLGYAVVPIAAMAWGAGWREIRIAAIATLTYTIGAFVASAWELATGATEPIVPVVAVLGLGFTVVAAFWLRRDEGEAVDAGPRPDAVARVVLGLATLSAATFGLLPLIAPAQFATLFGLAGTDTWVFRLAGAGCLGYATAGITSLRAPGYHPIRLQNFAAITFNGVAAASAWVAVVVGDGGLLAPVVAVAASFFTFALIWLDRRYAG